MNQGITDSVAKYVASICACVPGITPETVRKIETAVQPVISGCILVIDNIIPLFYLVYLKCIDFWAMLRPYKPELLFPSLLGLFLCFFGGNFVYLIAAAEAYRICGYAGTAKCIHILHDDLKRVHSENKKDDVKDFDNDGVPDVQQISHVELAQRKVLLFMRIVDPVRLYEAVAVITAGFFAVLATMKLQFAKTITLGTSIGESAERAAMKYILPYLLSRLPDDYKKWGVPAVSYTTKIISIAIAFSVQSIISIVHSSIRGGMIASKNILSYCSAMDYLHLNAEESYMDEALGYTLAVTGMWFQLSSHMGLFFPISFLLLPLTLADYLLGGIVNNTQ